MNRIESMKAYLAPYLVEQIYIKIRELRQVPYDNLVSATESLLIKALSKQEEQPEWKPSYMGMFHLMTGLVTGSHEFEIIMADSQLYLDESQVAGFWKPDGFYNDQQEEQYLKEKLQKKFVRINHYEILTMKHWFFYECRNLIEVYWKTGLDRIVTLDKFKGLQINAPFLFLFGDYMGEVHISLKYQKEDI